VANDSLIFDSNTNATTNNDFATNTQFNGITFAATAGAFTLGGNAVLLGGDINDNSTTQPETISLPLLLDGATSNVNVASGGSLALGALTFGLAAGSTNVSTLNVNNTVSATASATAFSVRTNTTAVNTINIAERATLNIASRRLHRRRRTHNREHQHRAERQRRRHVERHIHHQLQLQRRCRQQRQLPGRHAAGHDGHVGHDDRLGGPFQLYL
jgi:hypothetical protein